MSSEKVNVNMKFENYVSGVYKQQYQYKSFSPTPINHEWTWEDPKINTLLEQARGTLAELNAFSLIVPDIDRFIYMHVVKEANTSSRIEGTKTEMDEAILDKEQISQERRDDWQEVHNYITAMNYAIAELERLPLSTRLLRKTHEILLDGARGGAEAKTPGEFRRSQNWIGGSSLKDAVFIPPHYDEVADLMGDLEKFWHNEEIDVPDLIRIAISHYQFETIHPFLDGNGRIGRLLITLYLLNKGLLRKPSLYLSAHIEKHKGQYYDALTTVRISNDMAHWVKFFLVAVLETAKKGVSTFQAIMSLRDNTQSKIMGLGQRAQTGIRLLECLYQRPFINASEVSRILDISQPTANTLIKSFEDFGILKETTGFRRNRQYFFADYFKLFLE